MDVCSWPLRGPDRASGGREFHAVPCAYAIDVVPTWTSLADAPAALTLDAEPAVKAVVSVNSITLVAVPCRTVNSDFSRLVLTTLPLKRPNLSVALSRRQRPHPPHPSPRRTRAGRLPWEW